MEDNMKANERLIIGRKREILMAGWKIIIGDYMDD